jgi:hypothetical protein
MFKKFFVMALSLVLIATSAVTPRRSEAAIGALLASTGAGAGIFFGVVFIVLGLGGAVISIPKIIQSGEGPSETNKEHWFTLWAGIIALDEESRSISFAEISPEFANELEMTPGEREAYNKELIHLNLVTETMMAEINSGHYNTINEAAEGWKKYQDSFSPDAYSAFRKLMLHVSKQL